MTGFNPTLHRSGFVLRTSTPFHDAGRWREDGLARIAASNWARHSHNLANRVSVPDAVVDRQSVRPPTDIIRSAGFQNRQRIDEPISSRLRDSVVGLIGCRRTPVCVVGDSSAVPWREHPGDDEIIPTDDR